MQFPFNQFSPDQGDLSDGSLNACDGVQPLMPGNGFGPFPGLSVASTATALAATPRGLFSYQTADGTWQVAGFSQATVQSKQSDDTWSTIDSGLACTTGDDWSVERFGTKLLYTNTAQGMRAYDVETGGAASAVSAAGDPRFIFELAGILFCLDCKDDAATRNNKLIRSSAPGDHTNFDTKGSNIVALQTGDALVYGGRLNDTNALVLQKRAVKLIQVGNVGSSLWFPQTVSEESGSVGAKSCVRFNGSVYWFATDGFKRFSLAGGLENIGAGRVDQWFLSRVDQSDLSLIQGTLDPFRRNVMWAWKRASNASPTVFYDVIAYNFQFDRWFTVTIPAGITYLGFSAQTASTWDALDATLTWDAYNSGITWDSRYLQGGQPIFGAMDSAFKFGYFTGTSLAATIETAVQDSPVSSFVSGAMPMDDCATGTMDLGVRHAMNDTTTWKTGSSKQASGHVALRGRGNFIGFRRNIPAGATWTSAKGVDFIQSSMGGPR